MLSAAVRSMMAASGTLGEDQGRGRSGGGGVVVSALGCEDDEGQLGVDQCHDAPCTAGSMEQCWWYACLPVVHETLLFILSSPFQERCAHVTPVLLELRHHC